MTEQHSDKWDFFIAHAGEDLEIARKLYGRLKEHARVFLDDECLDPGDPWSARLQEAQSESRITVVLISKDTDKSYYEREEIAAAGEMARDTERQHRLVPIYLEDPDDIEVPYGLRGLHNMVLGELGLEGVVDRLRDLLPSVLRKPVEEKSPKKRGWRLSIIDYRIVLAMVIVGAIGFLSFRETLFGSAGKCIEIEHLTPNKIPHYLLDSVGSKNFPYWLKIVAKNNCDEPRRITISFESGENVKLDPTSRTFTMDVNTEREIIVKPRFTLPSKTTENVIIHWTVKNEVDEIIRADVIDSEIIPPFTLFWGLQKPIKPNSWEPVEESYILASLSAWMKPTFDTSAPVIKTCWGLGVDFGDAVETCYNYLFNETQQILVRQALFRFPNIESQRMRISPGKEIYGGVATSLEAALFFVSVMSDDSRYKVGTDPRLILFIAPPSNDQELKTTYLAWQSIHGEWKAVDFMHANSKRFQQNVVDASPRINALYNSVTGIKDTLLSKGGAGFAEKKKYAVIDYKKASAAHSIRGLP
jgi:hypothetical protein